MASEQELTRAQELLLFSWMAILPPEEKLPVRLSDEGYGRLGALTVSRSFLGSSTLGTALLPERVAGQAFTMDPEREIVIAFGRGGGLANYVGPDAAVLFNKTPAEFDDAIDWVRGIQLAYPNARIVLTGHSLGGAEAQYVASHLPGVSAVTFGAPGDEAAREGARPDASRDILNYMDRADLIARSREHLGRDVNVGPPIEMEPHSFNEDPGMGAIETILQHHYLENYLRDFGLSPADLLPAPSPRLPNHAELGSHIHTAAAYPLQLDPARAGLALTLNGPKLEQLALPRAERFAGLELRDGEAAPWPASGWEFARDYPEVAGTVASQGSDLVGGSDLVAPLPADAAAPGGAAGRGPGASLFTAGVAPYAPFLGPDAGAWNDPFASLSANADGGPDGRASAEPVPGRIGASEGGWDSVMEEGLDALPQLIEAGFAGLEGHLAEIGEKVAGIDSAPARLDGREVIRIVSEWIRRETNKPRNSSWHYDLPRNYTPPGPIPL